jgi:hypothetical protein
MIQIPNFEHLQIGETYFETSSDYYLAKCINIDKSEKNDGTNLYYNTATFEITTKTGRKVETTEKKFYLNK